MKKKDTFYFSHDYNARSDPKLVKLRVQLGYEAIGVYWSLIEYLYEQNGYLNINELDLIADSLHTNLNLLEKIVKKFDLFILKDKAFYSKAIIKRMKVRNEKAQKYKENAEKRWKNKNAKGMQSHSNGDAIALQTESDCNAIKERKVKESKGKEIKEKDSIETPDMAQNKINLQEAIKQVESGMKMKLENIFEYILVGNNNYQSKRKINLTQLIKSKYKTSHDLKKTFDYIKSNPGNNHFESDEDIIENIADRILYDNELYSTGINSNLKPELVNQLRLFLENKGKKGN